MAKFLSQIYTLPQHRIYFAAGETDNKVKCAPIRAQDLRLSLSVFR